MDKLPDIKFRAIGTVRSEIKERGQHDTMGIVSEIVIDPALAEALDLQGLEKLAPELEKKWFAKDKIPKNLFPPAQNLIKSYFTKKITVSE